MPPRTWARGSSLKHRKPGVNKYFAKPVLADGHRFASRHEYTVYLRLKADHASGLITGLVLQPSYEVCPKPHRIVYRPDFLVTYADGRQEAVDAKGFETPTFKLKAKLFRTQYPHIPLVLA